MSAPSRYLVAVVLALLLTAVGAGAFLLYQDETTSATAPTSSASSSTSDCVVLTSVDRVDLSRSSFGSVTTFTLPSPLRSPNSIVAAPDGSVWFGEVAVPGLAHLFLNGTLVEYPWPFPNSTPASLCFDRSEIWGVVLWDGLVWASDPANDQLVGMNQTTGALTVAPLAAGVIPRFLAVGPDDSLWFTETSTPAQVGLLQNGTTGPARYFSVPAAGGAYTASILFQSATLAYVTTVNPTDNHGQLFSFDPSSASPTFEQLGGNQTLLGPYGVAYSQGGVWLGEHEASHLAFLNLTSDRWSFYPTSTDPKLPLTLPYYLAANGSSLWFNEHDANRIADLTDGTTLSEYAISPVPIDEIGISNALTIALDGDLTWFTAWTANQVGFVNASIASSFSVSSPSNATAATVAPGSSTTVRLAVSGSSSRPLNVTFSDSETISSLPERISFSPSVSALPSLQGTVDVRVTVSVSSAASPGRYLLLMTVTDGLTWRSVYVPLVVS
ncbi:MAG: hypothetical protein ABSF83_12405 [Nitrososphaerales archaeon]